MFCDQCGAKLPETAKFCPNCGRAVAPVPKTTAVISQATTTQPAADPGAASRSSQYPSSVSQPISYPSAVEAMPASPAPSSPTPNRGMRGFSPRINDPAFASYIKKSNLWAGLFSVFLALAAIVGFTIAGQVSDDFTNPGAFLMGFALAIMFLLIGLFQVLGRSRSRTWDGTVEDKKIKKKTEHNDDYSESYLEYSVIIRSDQGKRHTFKIRNDSTLYNYFNIGDRVRHHGGLKTYEKYDKTGDRMIPCNACLTINEIANDYCTRCKCPLLK